MSYRKWEGVKVKSVNGSMVVTGVTLIPSTTLTYRRDGSNWFLELWPSLSHINVPPYLLTAAHYGGDEELMVSTLIELVTTMKELQPQDTPYLLPCVDPNPPDVHWMQTDGDRLLSMKAMLLRALEDLDDPATILGRVSICRAELQQIQAEVAEVEGLLIAVSARGRDLALQG